MDLGISHMINDAFSPLDDLIVQRENCRDLYNVPTTKRRQITRSQLVKPSVLFQCLPMLFRLHRSFSALEKSVCSFTKQYRPAYLQDLTNADYHKLRLLIDNYTHQFKDVFINTDIYIQHDQALVRYYGRRLAKLKDLVFSTLSRIDKELTDLYSSKRKSRYFSPISEADRWNNRNAKSIYQM